MNVTNAERVALRLWWFKPADMTDDDLVQWRKQRKRDKQASRRRQAGIRTKAQYLAALKAKPKPWEAHNMSRATWFRRKKQGMRLPVKQINSVTNASDLVSTSPQAESQQGCHEVSVAERPCTYPETSENRRGTHQAPCALASHPVSPNPLGVALEKLRAARKENDRG